MSLGKRFHIPMIGLISAFITLDIALLFLNLHVTKALQHNALMINVTGRQRMLSQRISKSLLIQREVNNTGVAKTEEIRLHNTLLESAEMFNVTLSSLTHGGDIIVPDGSSQYISPIQDNASVALVQQTAAIWSPVYLALQAMNQTPSESHIECLYTFALTENEIILDLMNKLAVRSEQITKRNATILRHAQMSVFTIVLLNFMLIVLRFYQANQSNSAFMHQLYRLIHCLPQAILLVDRKHRVVHSNKAMAQLLGKTPTQVRGKKLHTLLPGPCIDRNIELSGKRLALTVSKIITIPYVFKMVSLLDITESEQFKELSLKDPLTQLYNRTGLAELYEKREHDRLVTCLFLDLDKFKQVNDRYGHATGDQVLEVIARRLKQSLKANDIISRFGGDEFVILLNLALNEQQLASMSARLKKVINKGIQLNSTTLQVGVSIGCYIGDTTQDSLETMIHHADLAMYTDKARQSLSD